MKPRDLAFLALGLFLGYGLAAWNAERSKQVMTATERGLPEPETCHVLRVIDGGSLRVLLHGREEDVRLLRIDTPEQGDRGRSKATEALARLVGGSRVRLEYESSQGMLKRDESERVLAYVYLSDGRCANVEMVRQGWSGFHASHGDGRLTGQFEAAEAEAKEALRGLWRSEAAEFEELKVLE